MSENLAKLVNEVNALKAKLKSQPLTETFGQKEWHYISDKYSVHIMNYPEYEEKIVADIISNFIIWCQTYNGIDMVVS